LGICCFFFATFRAFVDDYAEVFDGASDDDDNGQGVKRPDYGWVGVVYRMAGKDPLKMDDVFNLPAREFMNALLLMKAMP
jgi:hypothetical protein